MFTETVLSRLTVPELSAAFKRVYHGYVLTLSVSPEWMERHIAQNCLRLEESPLWLDRSRDVVGLAALGVRDDRGWIGGFGLAPEFRGKALAAPLLDAVMTRAESLNLKILQLEVLQSNHRAFRTYEKYGFEILRKVVTLTCPIEFPAAPFEGSGVYPWDAVGIPSQVQMVWQRQLPWAALGGGLALGSAAGWLRFRVGRTAVALLDGSAPTREILQRLLADLRHRYAGKLLTISNEAVGSFWYRNLTDLDWLESVPQWEMHCQL